MEREAVLELLDSTTLHCIKTLTSKRSLAKVSFFEIENIPCGFSLLKLLTFLRMSGKLNFIFFVHKRAVSKESISYIIGCRNSVECQQFCDSFKEFSIDGCKFFTTKAKRQYEIRIAQSQVVKPDLMPKLIKMVASKEYNKFFPTERILEILIEADANNFLACIDGILIDYKHATRMMTPSVYISSLSHDQINSLLITLEEMGNSNVTIKDHFLLLMDKQIWCRQLEVEVTDDECITTVDPSINSKNLLTNDSKINDIRNSIL